ncbi:hypothetical protein IFM89_014120 [Coptis chinensis]|uniref:Peptidoglycan binding-like domain-containing protein n=1 Tax=Coptis chinensis TaxID=261450 RepID=A0A835HTM1_9MAGN|nr:hypothetical protein IFM89_014120 [Coptis chinensis]
MATSSSLLLLHAPPPPPSHSMLFHRLHTPSQLNSLSFHIHKPRCFSLVSASSSNNPSSSWEREEIRWLREEQRWIREEQRWVREETRWSAERESLVQEIDHLKKQVQALERQKSSSVSENVSSVDNILKVLKEVDLSTVNKNLISESGSGPIPMILESEKEEVKEMRDFDSGVNEEMKKRKNKRISSLRKGSEGVEVHAMQEALQNLGFYSGEEDMEFSSFSSGTERAVKTWQASLGACEDGIMTAELLEKLFMEQGAVDPNFHESTNGASVASVTEVLEIKQNFIKENEVAEFEASHHRVFLLGENRVGRFIQTCGQKQRGFSKHGGDFNNKVYCLSGRGTIMHSMLMFS